MISAAPSIEPRLKQELEETYQEMLVQGGLPPIERLEQSCALFQSRFGPERLSDLDGEALLNTMHANGPNSMVYWLEFKNDDEFPSPTFGGISGGSALKYGVYQRKDNGAWMTGSSRRQTELSADQAIEVARKHREQLVTSASLLEALPEVGADADYRRLQAHLDAQAPDTVRTAWLHKYLSVLFPNKVDTYHVDEYERFHLVKLLQTPPVEEGRYVASGRYVALARELGLSLIHLTHLLNRYHGRPYRVWRIGTRIDPNESIWPTMRDNGCVLIGWSKLGDLSNLTHDQSSKELLQESLQSQYNSAGNVASRKASEILNFSTGMAEGDLVLASDGRRIHSIGKITGAYHFGPDLHFGAPHQRPVEWLHKEGWNLPVSEGLQTTVYRIRKNAENLVALERLLQSAPKAKEDARPRDPIHKTDVRLDGIPGRAQAVLERKGQVILYGPPGTGKTYWAQRAVSDLASLAAFGRPYKDLEAHEQSAVGGSESDSGFLRICTFHPSYGYEDFMEGYRPRQSDTGQLVFERADGIFKSLCADAEKQPSKRFYLLIDEINRGDIPRIFGELLTILEKDKRGQSVYLPLSGARFAVPENVYLVGTMNTADRSIALLDTPLRTRFGFIELMPDYGALTQSVVGDQIFLGPWLEALNERIRSSIGRDARNRQIGHAYLFDSGRPVTDFARFSRILADDIVPLLEEYCYEDYTALAHILGRGLIDEDRQCVREELFNPDRRDDLVQALLEPYPEISTSPQAVALADSASLPEEDLDEQEEGE